MGTILKTTTDFDIVRALLGGVDADQLTDIMLDNPIYVGAAELVITHTINKQVPNGVRSVPEILVLDPSELDYIALMAAVAAYVAFLTTPGMTTLVNTSVTLGEQTIDLGGIGAQWVTQGTKYLNMTGFYLELLENWVIPEPSTMLTGGPTSSGREPNTIDGFSNRRGKRYITGGW